MDLYVHSMDILLDPLCTIKYPLWTFKCPLCHSTSPPTATAQVSGTGTEHAAATANSDRWESAESPGNLPPRAPVALPCLSSCAETWRAGDTPPQSPPHLKSEAQARRRRATNLLLHPNLKAEARAWRGRHTAPSHLKSKAQARRGPAHETHLAYFT